MVGRCLLLLPILSTEKDSFVIHRHVGTSVSPSRRASCAGSQLKANPTMTQNSRISFQDPRRIGPNEGLTMARVCPVFFQPGHDTDNGSQHVSSMTRITAKVNCGNEMTCGAWDSDGEWLELEIQVCFEGRGTNKFHQKRTVCSHLGLEVWRIPY